MNSLRHKMLQVSGFLRRNLQPYISPIIMYINEKVNWVNSPDQKNLAIQIGLVLNFIPMSIFMPCILHYQFMTFFITTSICQVLYKYGLRSITNYQVLDFFLNFLGVHNDTKNVIYGYLNYPQMYYPVIRYYPPVSCPFERPETTNSYTAMSQRNSPAVTAPESSTTRLPQNLGYTVHMDPKRISRTVLYHFERNNEIADALNYRPVEYPCLNNRKKPETMGNRHTAYYPYTRHWPTPVDKNRTKEIELIVPPTPESISALSKPTDNLVHKPFPSVLFKDDVEDITSSDSTSDSSDSDDAEPIGYLSDKPQPDDIILSSIREHKLQKSRNRVNTVVTVAEIHAPPSPTRKRGMTEDIPKRQTTKYFKPSGSLFDHLDDAEEKLPNKDNATETKRRPKKKRASYYVPHFWVDKDGIIITDTESEDESESNVMDTGKNIAIGCDSLVNLENTPIKSSLAYDKKALVDNKLSLDAMLATKVPNNDKLQMYLHTIPDYSKQKVTDVENVNITQKDLHPTNEISTIEKTLPSYVKASTNKNTLSGQLTTFIPMVSTANDNKIEKLSFPTEPEILITPPLTPNIHTIVPESNTSATTAAAVNSSSMNVNPFAGISSSSFPSFGTETPVTFKAPTFNKPIKSISPKSKRVAGHFGKKALMNMFQRKYNKSLSHRRSTTPLDTPTSLTSQKGDSKSFTYRMTFDANNGSTSPKIKATPFSFGVQKEKTIFSSEKPAFFVNSETNCLSWSDSIQNKFSPQTGIKSASSEQPSIVSSHAEISSALPAETRKPQCGSDREMVDLSSSSPEPVTFDCNLTERNSVTASQQHFASSVGQNTFFTTSPQQNSFEAQFRLTEQPVTNQILPSPNTQEQTAFRGSPPHINQTGFLTQTGLNTAALTSPGPKSFGSPPVQPNFQQAEKNELVSQGFNYSPKHSEQNSANCSNTLLPSFQQNDTQKSATQGFSFFGSSLAKDTMFGNSPTPFTAAGINQQTQKPPFGGTPEAIKQTGIKELTTQKSADVFGVSPVMYPFGSNPTQVTKTGTNELLSQIISKPFGSPYNSTPFGSTSPPLAKTAATDAVSSHVLNIPFGTTSAATPFGSTSPLVITTTEVNQSSSQVINSSFGTPSNATPFGCSLTPVTNSGTNQISQVINRPFGTPPNASPFGNTLTAVTTRSNGMSSQVINIPFGTQSYATPFGSTSPLVTATTEMNQLSSQGINSSFGTPTNATPFGSTSPLVTATTEMSQLPFQGINSSFGTPSTATPFGCSFTPVTNSGTNQISQVIHRPFGTPPNASPFGSTLTAITTRSNGMSSPVINIPFGTPSNASSLGSTSPLLNRAGTNRLSSQGVNSPFGTSPNASPFGSTLSTVTTGTNQMPYQGINSPFGTPYNTTPFGTTPITKSGLSLGTSQQSNNPFGSLSTQLTFGGTPTHEMKTGTDQIMSEATNYSFGISTSQSPFSGRSTPAPQAGSSQETNNSFGIFSAQTTFASPFTPAAQGRMQPTVGSFGVANPLGCLQMGTNNTNPQGSSIPFGTPHTHSTFGNTSTPMSHTGMNQSTSQQAISSFGIPSQFPFGNTSIPMENVGMNPLPCQGAISPLGISTQAPFGSMTTTGTQIGMSQITSPGTSNTFGMSTPAPFGSISLPATQGGINQVTSEGTISPFGVSSKQTPFGGTPAPVLQLRLNQGINSPFPPNSTLTPFGGISTTEMNKTATPTIVSTFGVPSPAQTPFNSQSTPVTAAPQFPSSPKHSAFGGQSSQPGQQALDSHPRSDRTRNSPFNIHHGFNQNHTQPAFTRSNHFVSQPMACEPMDQLTTQLASVSNTVQNNVPSNNQLTTKALTQLGSQTRPTQNQFTPICSANPTPFTLSQSPVIVQPVPNTSFGSSNNNNSIVSEKGATSLPPERSLPQLVGPPNVQVGSSKLNPTSYQFKPIEHQQTTNQGQLSNQGQSLNTSVGNQPFNPTPFGSRSRFINNQGVEQAGTFNIGAQSKIQKYMRATRRPR